MATVITVVAQNRDKCYNVNPQTFLLFIYNFLTLYERPRIKRGFLFDMICYNFGMELQQAKEILNSSANGLGVMLTHEQKDALREHITTLERYDMRVWLAGIGAAVYIALCVVLMMVIANMVM